LRCAWLEEAQDARCRVVLSTDSMISMMAGSVACASATIRSVFIPLVRSYHALAKNGTLVVFGTAAAAPGTAQPLRGLAATLACVVVLKLRPGCRRVVPRAIDSAKPPRPDECRQDVQTVLARLQDGTIKPQIAQVLPLSEARHAHELREASKVTGQIILQP